MSEPLNDVNDQQNTDTNDTVDNSSNTDAVLAKVKELLKVAGHDVESVFDDVVALAKKLV